MDNSDCDKLTIGLSPARSGTRLSIDSVELCSHGTRQLRRIQSIVLYSAINSGKLVQIYTDSVVYYHTEKRVFIFLKFISSCKN